MPIRDRAVPRHLHREATATSVPGPHASTHENGGVDELNVAGLNGVLADEQDAGKIKGVSVDDTNKAAGAMLVYDGSDWKVLGNDTFLIGRNNAGDGDVDMWKVNNSDQIEAGANIKIGTYSLGDGTGTLVFDGSGNLTASGTFDSSTVNITTSSLTEYTGYNKYYDMLQSDGDPIVKLLTHVWDGASWVATTGFAFGPDAMWRNKGIACNAFGSNALKFATGDYLNGFGENALSYCGVDYCDAFGTNAGAFNEGRYTCSFGFYSNTYNKGLNSSSYGMLSGRYNTGNNGNFFGHSSGEKNNGINCSGIGSSSLKYGPGDNNSALGYSAFGTFNEDTANAKTFDNTDISAPQVTITAHGFGSVGSYCQLKFTQGTSNVPGIITTKVELWKIIDANTLQCVSDTITGAGTGTGHTLTPQFIYENSTAIGANSEPDASNQVMLGDTNVTQVATAGDFRSDSGVLMLAETTTPSAVADYGKIYTKSDNKLYFQDGAGVEHEVSLV